MKCIVLAAGFATRLYPLTRNFPKPLLEVGGATIIDRLLRQVRSLNPADVRVVCNAKFVDHFRAWCPTDVSLVINDARDEDERLGAIGDLALALHAVGEDDDVLVAAADNIFELDFAEFARHFHTAACSSIAVWHNPDELDRCRRGNVVFDGRGRVTAFVEKPVAPASSWSSAPIYLYKRADLTRVNEYLEGGGNADAPGHFVEWLVERTPVSAFVLRQRPVDIGNLQALQAARSRYGG